MTIDAEPSPPPFVGLQRNARAIVVGLALIAAILVLLPDLAPLADDLPEVQVLHGRVVEILDSDEADPGAPDVRILVVRGVADGPQAGDILEASGQGPTGVQSRPEYAVGDDVIVNVSTDPEAPFVAVVDRYRIDTLLLLVGIFAAAVIVVGGWRGVRSLIALGLTLVVVVRVVVPLILAGWDPALVAIVTATGVTLVTFLLTEGARRHTFAAAAGTFLSLVLVAILAVVFDSLARFTPLRGSESAGFIVSLGGVDLDLGGLMLAAVIFGALGVLDDVTVTQAATVQELHDADPRAGRRLVATRAMNVGRSHIAATVNTLVLAYVGASLPLIILFAAGRADPRLIVSTEIVAVEVVRALVGSIGIVAAVPLTTAIAASILDPRRPRDPQRPLEHRAPGWAEARPTTGPGGH